MASIGILHVTDLHQGLTREGWLWPNVKEQFFQDLVRLHRTAGPWDILLFSGDLTQSGSNDEFEKLDVTLDELWRCLRSLDDSPVLLAVPGNHDLDRSVAKQAAGRALLHWHDDEDLRQQFWDEREGEYARLVSAAFEPYSRWWAKKSSSRTRIAVRLGIIPGDFATVVTKDEISLGVIGLNSAFLQLKGGDFRGRLELDPRQLLAVTDGEPSAWLGRNTTNILMTHHSDEWLHPKSREVFRSEIYLPKRFLGHFFGHMHEGRSHSLVEGGADPRRFFQGSALFGLDKWSGKIDRVHGFTAYRLSVSDAGGELRAWPRTSRVTQAGVRKLVQDDTFDLEEDGAYALTFKVLNRPTPSLLRQAFTGSPLGTEDHLGQHRDASPVEGSMLPSRDGADERLSQQATGPVSLERLRVLPFRAPKIRGLAWSHDGRRLAALGSDHVAIWDAGTWGKTASFDVRSWMRKAELLPSTEIVELLALAWAPSGDLLALTTRHGVIIWDLQRDVPSRVHLSSTSEGWLWGCAWSPSADLLALATGNRHVRLVDVRANRELDGFELTHPCYKPAWAHRTNRIACGTEHGLICLAEIDGGKVKTVLELRTDFVGIHSVAWAPDDSALAFGAWDGATVIRELATGEDKVLTGHSAQVDDLDFSADGRLLATKAQDETVRVWDRESSESVEIREPIAFLGGGVAFHPRAPQLATLCDRPRGHVRIWMVNELLSQRNAPKAASRGHMIKLFLASSSELRADRDEFDLYFRQLNDDLRKKGHYLEIVRWESSLGAMSKTRLQDEYNSQIRSCDVLVCLFDRKVGEFTSEEFDVAVGQFKKTGKPYIYTFFKDEPVKRSTIRKEDMNSLWAFQNKLSELGHYWAMYESIEHLKRQFRDQLDKVMDQQ